MAKVYLLFYDGAHIFSHFWSASMHKVVATVIPGIRCDNVQ